MGERELKKLRMEVNSLQTECQQGKTLIKSLTQVKGEKAVLEEKVWLTSLASVLDLRADYGLTFTYGPSLRPPQGPDVRLPTIVT